MTSRNDIAVAALETNLRKKSAATAYRAARQLERGPARNINDPQPGFWAMRLTRGGVEVGCCIKPRTEPGNPSNILDRSPHMIGFKNGVECDAMDVWLRSGREIDEAEYEFLVADRQWAAEHAPDSFEAQPTKSVDRKSIPIPFL